MPANDRLALALILELFVGGHEERLEARIATETIEQRADALRNDVSLLVDVPATEG